MKEGNIPQNKDKDGLSPKGRFVMGNILVKLWFDKNVQAQLNQWFGKEVIVVENKK